MDFLLHLTSKISALLWDWPMVVALLGVHIYLTIILKFPQRYVFKGIAMSMKGDSGHGDVSQLGALSTALAATIGTGNIIGVATAVALGGPGAVFWCWMTGLFAISTKYAESLLSVRYRVHKPDGSIVGGPMYVLEHGMGMKWLGVIFAFFVAIATFGIGCSVQSNAISGMFQSVFNISPYVTGLVVALLVALVIFFGVKGIAKICTMLVPVMAIFYIFGCLMLLFINRAFVVDAIALIVKSAFTTTAAGGGFIGATIMVAMRFGIARGLFSNESGMGSAPIVAAAASTSNPVRQALVSATATFWDTVVICAITGIVIVSGVLASYGTIDTSCSSILTAKVFQQLPFGGDFILTISLFTFAFSTILGWSYYGEKAIEYLFNKRAKIIYRLALIAMAFVGAVVDLSLVWNFSDIANALMTIPNLIALVCMHKVLVRDTRYFLWEKRINEYDKTINEGYIGK